MTKGSVPGLCYSFDDFVLEHESLRLFRAGSEIRLTPLSGKLLRALAAHAPGTLSYEAIRQEVWGGRHVSATAIKQRVKLLRRALRDNGRSPRYIALVRGVGYRLVPAVAVSSGAVQPARQPLATSIAGAPPTHTVWRNRGALLVGSALLLALAVLLPGWPGSPEPAVSPAAEEAAIPIEARELVNLGKFLYHRRESGDIERAKEHFEKAIAMAPDYAEPWVFLAGIYWGMGHDGVLPVAEATRLRRQALERALTLRPDLVDARVRLALLDWSVTGSTENLAQVVDRALELEPSNPLALTSKAYLLQLRGDWDAAMATHEAAAAANPTSVVYQGNLARFYMQRGRLDEAETALLKVLDLHPGLRGRLTMEFAELRLMQGRPREALELIAEVPDETDRLALAAMAYHLLGDSQQTRHRLDRLRQQQSPWSLFRLVELRHFTDAGEPLEDSLEAFYAMAKADPSLMGEAQVAAKELCNSPFINWMDRPQTWSRLLKEQYMVSSWAPTADQPSVAGELPEYR